jgi:hypothetical protein
MLIAEVTGLSFFFFWRVINDPNIMFEKFPIPHVLHTCMRQYESIHTQTYAKQEMINYVISHHGSRNSQQATQSIYRVSLG